MSPTENACTSPAERTDTFPIMIRSVEPRLEIVLGEAGPLPDVYGVTDLPKTEEETAAIAEVVEALNWFRRFVCDLPPVRFAPEMVHVLTPEEYRTKVVPERFQARTWLGHVYLWRGWPPPVFQAILANIMVQASACLRLDLNGPAAAQGEKGRRSWLRRSGLVTFDPGQKDARPHFHGLSQGAAEYIAMCLRQRLARQSRLLDEAGKKTVAGFMTSPPLAYFTERLIMTASGTSVRGSVGTAAGLFLDYFHGTDVFLGKLEGRLPGATEILRHGGATPVELSSTADKLGFGDTAAFIRQFCR